MHGNRSLGRARIAKNDEFYTLMSDIEKEIPHYADHLRGKIVYSNCDRAGSKFIDYFLREKDNLGLKAYYATGVDYRSDGSMMMLDKADVVITNPPFSLFREYLEMLYERGKKFLIIGNINAVITKSVFDRILAGELWLGVNKRVSSFDTPSGERKHVSSYWYTNIDHGVKNPPLALTERYDPAKYPKYDNYDAIEVSKCKLIPYDYKGMMGVPSHYMVKHCAEQFDLLGAPRPVIGGKPLFRRLLIKKKVV